MNLYLISQDKNDGYDTYDAAVVAANTENEARMIHPGGGANIDDIPPNCWVANAEDVSVRLIGTAVSGRWLGVILASFNAR